MNAPPAFPFKIGTTFNPVCTYYPPSSDTPADMTAFDITSQIRTKSGSLIATLEVIKLSGLGQFTFYENTDTWPQGVALWDMKFFYGGVQFYTATVSINVIQYQTDPEL